MKTISQTRTLLLLFFVALSVFTSGCGGGGGSGTALSPEELEVATVVEAFSAAINQENRNDALVNIFTSVKYYGGTTATPLGYNDLSNRLQNLFDNSGAINFRISNLGVTVSSETLASARGQLELEYTPVGGIPQFLSESVELKFEKDGRWGIVELAQYGTSGTTNTAFPPQP